jgi:hypothetical protein
MITKRTFVCIGLIFGLVLFFGYPKASIGGIATWELSFKGTASGGTLVLAKTLNRTVKYVSIQTSQGESAETVAQRLVDTINGHNSRQTEDIQYDPHWLWIGGYKANASGSNVTLPGSPDDYVIAGSERGLGIPQPPHSLSCSYDKQKNEVILHWINPESEFDLILVKAYWSNFSETYTKSIRDMSSSFTINCEQIPINTNDMEFRVIGIHGDIKSSVAIPSNATAIHVTNNGNCQEETYGIPFVDGVAPNWKAWGTTTESNRSTFEQGKKYPDMQSYNPARALLTKPFYQIIKAPAKGVEQGVYRKFLGLTPGHTYRLTASLSTLEMDSVEDDWSFSLHAAPNGPDGKDLTVKQLAGLAALPDGKSGQQAGRIKSFGKGDTTRGTFELAFSDEKDTDETQSTHITLPSGVDSITVWVKFKCSDPNGKVGFSGVKLEDITTIKNPKSPAEIRGEETKEEIRLLKLVEKELREE